MESEEDATCCRICASTQSRCSKTCMNIVSMANRAVGAIGARAWWSWRRGRGEIYESATGETAEEKRRLYFFFFVWEKRWDFVWCEIEWPRCFV
jgi:hypothetical protein